MIKALAKSEPHANLGNLGNLRSISDLKVAQEDFIDMLTELAGRLSGLRSQTLLEVVQKIEVWRHIVSEDAADHSTASLDEALTLSIMNDIAQIASRTEIRTDAASCAFAPSDCRPRHED